jgi:hypothetical protein
MAAVGIGLWDGAPSAMAQPAFQAPPVLRARELLPPDMLAGPHFQVDDRVPTDGLLGHFTLRSGFGTFVAPGRELLRIRIAELPAIQQLETTSQTDVFLQAAGNAAAKPVDAVVSLVTDPVQTLQGIPTGISRFFDRVELGAQRIAQAASDPTKTEQQRTQEAASRIGSATITALGFEQVRRQLAKGLGVDPYTTNPVLSKKLTDTAWVGFSGRLGVNLLVSAFVPGSTALSGVSFTHDLVYDTPAADLIVLNQQKMLAMGASDAGAKALLGNKWFSLSVLTAMVTELERLSGVEGRPEVLALATTATKEEEARFFAAAVHVLARLNVSGVPLRRVTGRGTVVGVARDGMVVVPAPVDYLAWTERVGGLCRPLGPPGGPAGHLAVGADVGGRAAGVRGARVDLPRRDLADRCPVTQGGFLMARCAWRDWSCAAAAALGLAVAMPSSADDAQPRLARAGEALGAARLHDAEGDRAADGYHLIDARLDIPAAWRFE